MPSCAACSASKIKCVREHGDERSCKHCLRRSLLCVPHTSRSASLAHLRTPTTPTSPAPATPPTPLPSPPPLKRVRVADGLASLADAAAAVTAASHRPAALAAAVPAVRLDAATFRDLELVNEAAQTKGKAWAPVWGALQSSWWSTPLPPTSEWATLPVQRVFSNIAKGAVLAHLFGERTLADRLTAVAESLTGRVCNNIGDIDTIQGYHLLSRQVAYHDLSRGIYFSRTAYWLARSARAKKALDLGAEEYKLATTILHNTAMELYEQGIPFSLQDLQYVPLCAGPPPLDAASPLNIYVRLHYELLQTRLDMLRSCSLAAILCSQRTPTKDMLQQPQIDNFASDPQETPLAAAHRLRSRIAQTSDVMEVAAHNWSKLPLEAAWAYLATLIHRIFLRRALGEKRLALRDAHELLSQNSTTESFVAMAQDRHAAMLMNVCHLAVVSNDAHLFDTLMRVFVTKAKSSDFCRAALQLLQAAWDERIVPTEVGSDKSVVDDPAWPETNAWIHDDREFDPFLALILEI